MKNSVLTLNDVRAQLTDDQQEILDIIWTGYREKSQWLEGIRAGRLYSQLGIQKEDVDRVLKELGGSVVFYATDAKRYVITFIGGLLTAQGKEAEQMIVCFLEYVRDQAILLDFEIDKISFQEVSTALQLTEDQSQLFRQVINLIGNPFAQLSGDELIPFDIDDLVGLPDLQAYVQKRALRDYDPDVPIDGRERIFYSYPQVSRDEQAHSVLPEVTIVKNTNQLLPVAFLSYVHFDDEHNHGRITEFRQRLSAEVRAQTGEQFPIFQDREGIQWGQQWEERVEQSINQVTFLIPILTPSFFRSEPCRDELKEFLVREKELKRNDLILPLYFVDTPLLNDPTKRASDELAEIIASRQYADWRALRFEPFTSPTVGKALETLAVQIREALERTPVIEIVEEIILPNNLDQEEVGIIEAQEAIRQMQEILAQTDQEITPSNNKINTLVERISGGPEDGKLASLIAAELRNGNRKIKGFSESLNSAINTITNFVSGYVPELDPSNERDRGELNSFREIFIKSKGLMETSLSRTQFGLKLRLSSEVIRAERERMNVRKEMNSVMKGFLDFSLEIVNTINEKLNDRKGIAPEIQERIGKFGFKDASSFQAKLALAIKTYNLASVLFMDLDNFKSVNDSYNHVTGDHVIREALVIVQNIVKEKGELFHRSGDEMMVLLPNINDPDARAIAEQIRVGIEQKHFSTIGQGLVTTTIGFATYPDTCDRWENLENTADETAMRAKKAKRNRVANCLEKLDLPPTVTDRELADTQFEIQRLDALAEDRPDTGAAVAQTKLQQIFLLRTLVGRLQAEGRPALAWKLQRQIRAIELRGRVMTPSQRKLEKLIDIEADRNAHREEEERKNKKR